MRNKNTIMTLFQKISPSYEHMITALEMISMKELIMKYVTACLMCEVLKRKEKKH